LPLLTDRERYARRRQQEASLSAPKKIDGEESLAFLELLWALDQGLNRLSKRMLANLGVTGPQRAVVRLIGRYPGLTAGEIAQRAHHHPSTLSIILRRLEEQGYVHRAEDTGDHRRVRLTLSRAGKRIDALRKGTVEAAVRAALDRMGPADRQAAAKAFGLLVEELERASRKRD
jgi:DNA-binding MarR family transcriptional regulator